MKSFREYRSGNMKPTWESKKRLSLSIQNADNYLINSTKIEEFLTTPIIIERKYNGIKFNILKINNTGRSEEDYIVSHNNEIIQPNEYSFLSKNYLKHISEGVAQLQLVWEHLKKIRKNDIPIGTEMYLIKEDDIILLSHSKSTYEIRGNKIFTKPKGYFTDKRDIFAESLKICTPDILFEGMLSSKIDLLNGMKDTLRESYRKHNIAEVTLKTVNELLSDFEYIIRYKTKNVILKKYNHKNIKINEDKDYNEFILNEALKLSKKLKQNTSSITEMLQSQKISYNNQNREQILEDVYTKSKQILSKRAPGNNGIMIIDKFKIITNEHYTTIREALAKYDTVSLVIISSKDTKGTKNFRNTMINEVFGNIGSTKLEIINTSSKSVEAALEKSKYNINEVQGNFDTNISSNSLLENYELKEEFEDIEQQIIKHINDRRFFETCTPKAIHKFYNEIKAIYE